jgi:hypothetical protein
MITQSDTARSGVVVRRYTAPTYAMALSAYETDLPPMVEAGYYPVGQSWGLDGGAPGYGTLAVTYRWDGWAVAERQVSTAEAGAGAGTGDAGPGA